MLLILYILMLLDYRSVIYLRNKISHTSKNTFTPEITLIKILHYDPKVIV